MTNEEAIKNIKEHCYFANLIPQAKEALDMAIKALEQEPCEDCISRQAVIDSIRNYFHDEYYQRTSIQDCRDCLIEDVIKPLPSDTPQTKTGHWQKISADKYSEHVAYYFRCSECGKDIIGERNYCPNCGLKMEVEE